MSEPERDSQRGTPRGRTRSLYGPLDWVLVRAPMLPVETWRALADEVPVGAGATLTPPDAMRRTAIAVASPDLSEQLEATEAGATGAPRLAGALLRYTIRMSTRPTPFGMFAGVGLARLGAATELRIGAGPPHTRMRPDMGWLLAFVAQLEQLPQVRRELRVLANQAAWTGGDRVLIAERTAVDGSGESGAVGIRATHVVRRALDLSRNPRPWGELASRLLATPGATEEKIEELLTELWRQTFLLSELRPPLTHPAPARYVLERLAPIAAAGDAHTVLSELLAAMAAWDRLDVAHRPEALAALGRQAAMAVPHHHGSPVQVDSALALEGAVVTDRIGESAARAADLLVRLTQMPTQGRLESYRRAFADRYGIDREVALLELLDPERGLGPPTVSGQPPSAVDAGRLASRHATLRRLAIEALRDRELVVRLDEGIIDELAPPGPDAATAPLSLDLSVFVLAESRAAIDGGDFRVMVGPNLGAQAAGRNLGRFADLLGEPARDAVSAVAAAEVAHSPGDVHAELVYLPRRGRSANVAIRPSAHHHEVVVGTTPHLDSSMAIPLSELLVGVRDGRFYVRWPGEPGDLLVHVGHMLTSHMAPEACQFLEEVTRGERAPLAGFQWGAVADLPFLPRLEVDGIVLSPARWQIDVATRDARLPPDAEDFQVLLGRWRSDWLVPRRVYLTAGDNRLLLDLDARMQAEQLRQELRRMRVGAVILQEPLPGPEHAWLPGPDGHHLPELVVSLVQRPDGSSVGPTPVRTEQVPPAPPAPPAPSVHERLRLPGSEWLYAKIYGPRAGQDELLAGAVRSFGQFVVGAGLVDRWFFVRYADPEPHLRLRFAGRPDRLLTEVLPQMCEWADELVADGSCSRLSFDTYEREIERYGGVEAMNSVEEIFAADSAAVAELLHLARFRSSSADRTTMAVLSIDALLDALGLDVGQRIRLCRDGVSARRASGEEYRQRQRTLRRHLGEQDRSGDAMDEPGLARILGARRAALVRPAEELRTLAGDGRLTKPIDRVCQSIVHLHCNRLLGTDTETEQLVLGLLLRTREGLERAPLA